MTERQIAKVTITLFATEDDKLRTHFLPEVDETILREVDPSLGVMAGIKLIAIKLVAGGNDNHLMDIIRMCGTKEEIAEAEAVILAVAILSKTMAEAQKLDTEGDTPPPG